MNKLIIEPLAGIRILQTKEIPEGFKYFARHRKTRIVTKVFINEKDYEKVKRLDVNKAMDYIDTLKNYEKEPNENGENMPKGW